ncbi:MAG: hypothetical protein QME65_00640 [Candidatus Omnitrophota bacterium]|nr:hypothetical protein [Candidatus Omnitrophota bacterium]
MRKTIRIFLVLTLLIGASPKISLAGPVSNQQPAQGLGETFAALALDKFSNDNPGQDTSLL